MSGPFGATPWMYDHTDFYPLDINQSLKFNDDESQYLTRTPTSAGNRDVWTWSCWLKHTDQRAVGRTLFSVDNGSASDYYLSAELNTSGELSLSEYTGSAYTYRYAATPLYRDPSAWMNVVWAVDTTQGTAANRVKLYVNGVQVTDFRLETDPSQNADTLMNSINPHYIGCTAGQLSGSGAPYRFYDGYLSEVYFIDGQALAPTNFGEFKEGIWIPKVYNGTYGSNGFHLPFKNDDTVEGFNAVTYRGNGGTQSISGLGFKPDLVWGKSRSAATSHFLFDSVRGATKDLRSDLTQSEQTNLGLTSFDADGFSISSSSSLNTSAGSYVAWAWDAGSGSPVSNTDGTITSTVKANPSYGFSILNYVGNGTAGATVGHSLGAVPDLFIIKNRDQPDGWGVYYGDATKFIYLNLTDLAYTALNRWNNTAPTSSVFTLGDATAINTASENYIAYCFAEVAGYSSIGSYSGTGSTVSVNTGFKAAWLLIKRTDTSGFSWVMLDNTRNPSGELDDFLLAETNIVETNNGTIKVLPTASGFDVTGTATSINANGGTYIYMAFADTREAAFWKDVSGQGNHWTPNNLDYRDSLPDSTTNNFATWNPLVRNANTFSEGNLKVVCSASTPAKITSTIGFSSGKWHSEWLIGPYNNWPIGISKNTLEESYISSYSIAYWPYSGGAQLYAEGTQITGIGVLGTTTWASGDVLGLSVNADTKVLSISKNGTFIGSYSFSAYSGWDEIYFAAGNYINGNTYVTNFGQDSTFSGAKPMGAYTDDSELGTFQHQPLVGFKSLCSANLPTPTIVDGSDYFNTVLYTGTGATRSITGVNHQPDLVWLKSRSNLYHHGVFDVIRGPSAALYTSLTNAEGTESGVTSFDSDGFSLGTSNGTNLNGGTFASWNWKAGGTAVSNTAGTITSQVSANPTAGFSIVSYVGNASYGQTVGHGLGVAPEMVIIKNRSDARNWRTYHSALGATKYINIDETAAAGTYGSFNNTAPTSTVFSTTNSGSADRATNFNGDNYIAYCFANTEGYLKAGSYVGNGSADGPFIYLGFRASWIMIKNTLGVNSWCIYDVERDTYNVSDALLQAQDSAAEAAYGGLDFTSNGFKIRSSVGALNGSGNTLIYLAFSENPFKYSNAR